jgi:hypothetical protein
MFEHPDVVCPYCTAEPWENCVTASYDERSAHQLRLQLSQQPRLERDHRFSKIVYITTCSDCDGPVWVDKYGFIEEHPVPRKAVWCEGSLLRDLDAQGSDLHFTTMSAGAFEMNRSKH